MKRNIFKSYILLIALGLTVSSCADLTVVNETAPDAARALANADDVKSLAGGGLKTVYTQQFAYDGVGLAMEVMADHTTCSWGNAAMRDLSWEPRINAFNNNLTYAYFPTVRLNWENSYGAISAVNSVLQQMYARKAQLILVMIRTLWNHGAILLVVWLTAGWV
jgi:hypothetical protein